MKTVEEYREIILNSLESCCGGVVYLKTTVIPAAYPAGTFEFTGFERDGGTATQVTTGNLLFNLYMIEDATDYAKSGDVWVNGEESGFDESGLWLKAETLSKSLKLSGIETERIGVYPMTGDGGRDLYCAKIAVKCRYKIR